jgi:hypothetical protein
MHGSITRWTLFLGLASGVLGCALHPRYEARIIEAQKDVLFVLVSVPERLAAADYRELAEKELRKLLAARQGGSVPLYEVRFEFLGPRGEDGREVKFASFSWRNVNPAGPTDLTVTEASDLVRR